MQDGLITSRTACKRGNELVLKRGEMGYHQAMSTFERVCKKRERDASSIEYNTFKSTVGKSSVVQWTRVRNVLKGAQPVGFETSVSSEPEI